VFAAFAAVYCKRRCWIGLEVNEKAGVVYHYKGQLVGDYDVPETGDGILRLLASGREKTGASPMNYAVDC
jgi:hypothetical protein